MQGSSHASLAIGDSLVGRETLRIVYPLTARPSLMLAMIAWSTCLGVPWNPNIALRPPRVLLAAFVGKFEFEQTYPDEEIVIKGGITARPQAGMRLNVKPVEW